MFKLFVLVFAAVLAIASAGVVSYSAPAYSGVAPVAYSAGYGAPVAYSAGYGAPLAYSGYASPYVRSAYSAPVVHY